MEAEDLMNEMEPNEPYGTRELADKTDTTRRTTLNYLNELADNGHIRKKKIDSRRAVWILHDD